MEKFKKTIIVVFCALFLIDCAKGDNSTKKDATASAGSTTTAKYTDYSNMTVRETVSGLVWKKCAQGQTNDASCSGTAGDYTYCASADNACNGGLDTGVLSISSGAANDAYTICDFLNANPAGGYASITNWRVPTKNELVNYTLESTATEFSSLFPNRLNGDYWSANSYIASNAHFVDQNGSSFGTAKDATNHVRCVSSGH